ncbi:hypothetical protein SDJN03_25972, partial [Cucurbita argyrosperma subsp. sororia]
MADLSSSPTPAEPPAAASAASIQALELSIQNVMKLNQRRRKWHTLFATPIPNTTNPLSSWRSHLITFLESTPSHLITIVLLLTDLIVTVLELSSSLISCNSPVSHKREEEVMGFHWVSIAILSLLSTKTVALVVGLGLSFFRRPGCVVDGVVVGVALGLEVAAKRRGGGVIMVGSLWRIVRVVESAFELSDDAIEAKIEGIVWELEGMKEEIRREKENEVIDLSINLSNL